MARSEEIGELAKALAAAQGAMEGAKKDATNPHFKSKYADLASCWEAVREPLSKNGLSVVQLPFTDAEGRVFLSTMLMHSSGQWLELSYSLPAMKQDAQGIGSALTYMRRYALVGLGIAPEDDDGESAVGRSNAPARAPVDDPRPKAIEWARKAEKEIRAMTTDVALTEWEKKNNASMVKLRAVDETLHRNVLDVWAERSEQLNAKMAAE